MEKVVISKMEKIKEFLEKCPYLSAGKINIDYIKEKHSYSLEESPVNPVLNNFKDGSKRMQIVFDFIIRNNYSVLENIANTRFCEDFIAWINKQNNEGKLPNIEGIDWIKCTGRGTIINTTETTSVYAIPMQVAYIEEF